MQIKKKGRGFVEAGAQPKRKAHRTHKTTHKTQKRKSGKSCGSVKGGSTTPSKDWKLRKRHTKASYARQHAMYLRKRGRGHLIVQVKNGCEVWWKLK